MVIIGRSGGGKSVLLKHILGLMQPDAGEVWFRDKDLAKLSEEQLVPLRKETGMLFQNGALFDSLTRGRKRGLSPAGEGETSDEEEIRGEVTARPENRRSAQAGEQMALGAERRHAQAGGPGAGRHRQAGPDAL